MVAQSTLKNKKVLVTGADGFIGSHLVEELVRQGCAVRALVLYNSFNRCGWLDTLPEKTRSRIEIVPGDVRDNYRVRQAVKGMDAVFNLAALISIPYSYEAAASFIDTNVKGVLNILEAARDSGVKRVVHTSTSEIYGTAQFVPIHEAHPVNPQSPYAATKAGADFLALSFYRAFGLPVTIVRPFNTYGPRQSTRAVIPTIITQIVQGARTIRLGSLFPTRDLTFVRDTVAGFVKAAATDRAVGEVVNLGTGSEISIGDLAKLIARLLHADIAVESDGRRKRPARSEVERLCSDNAKARNLLAWKPAYTLEQGLIETIAWFKENKHLYRAGEYHI
ncbi:MAG TPA: NAD-dependent 4,6-dehydratase LegB [Candidatus Omnitrophota bacterium]|nr:NAD-dependent 4,6-dehydratase LegB [Candidatus Omnitrophota bacterium]HRZ15289.1 NAD-dependent 4,6-dehydratase LegB [Candidatus Omnitrophota bacterium]